MKTTVTIDTVLLKKAALRFRAINNDLRKKILVFIHKKGTTSVTPLYKALRLRQSVASLHLAILRRAGLVVKNKEGKEAYYSVDYKSVELLHKQAQTLLKK